MGCDRLKTVPEQGEQAELDRKPFGRGLGDTEAKSLVAGVASIWARSAPEEGCEVKLRKIGEMGMQPRLCES